MFQLKLISCLNVYLLNMFEPFCNAVKMHNEQSFALKLRNPFRVMTRAEVAFSKWKFAFSEWDLNMNMLYDHFFDINVFLKSIKTINSNLESSRWSLIFLMRQKLFVSLGNDHLIEFHFTFSVDRNFLLN
jgi:hypothetical protein